MSGRGLGHTGGTLDKLESVQGYNVNLTEEQFASIISKDGFAMMGQTPSIAPADKKMYALRDVTGTVESIPLITSSILSKKAAEGSDALVFDVKCGSGAFMKSEEDAEKLAEFLVKTIQAMGKKAVAVITRMDTPLGFKTGNYLEIEETLECLQGKGPEDIMELTYTLGSHMLVFGNKAKDVEEGRKLCEDAVASGKALEVFLQNINDQGGNAQKLLADNGLQSSHFAPTLLSSIPLGRHSTVHNLTRPAYLPASAIYMAAPSTGQLPNPSRGISMLLCPLANHTSPIRISCS